jgi:glycosyltransferase involved in cell wall biosynthesis
MKKVLIITYYWPPAGGPGVQRWLKFVKYLPEFGVQPFVLTVDPKYASYPVMDQTHVNDIHPKYVFRTKTFELFSLYQKLSRKKEIPHSGFVNDGSPSLFGKAIRLIRSNFFIPDPRRGWNRFALKEAIKLIQEKGISTIITTSPPHSSQLIGLKLKRKLPGIKWIADLRDPWTEIYYYHDLYHTRISKKIDESYEKKVLKGADKVFVVGHYMKKQFLEKYQDIANEHIEVVYNGFDKEDFENIELNNKTTKELVITYTGTLAANYNIAGFLSALKYLNDIKVCIVGVIAQKWINEIKAKGLIDRFEIIPTVPHRESIKYLLNSDVLLLVIPETKGNKAIVTGKIFEYIAAQKPILGIGPLEGEVDLILKENALGQMFNYIDDQNIMKFISNQLEKNQQIAPDNSVSEKYKRQNQVRNIINVLS